MSHLETPAKKTLFQAMPGSFLITKAIYGAPWFSSWIWIRLSFRTTNFVWANLFSALRSSAKKTMPRLYQRISKFRFSLKMSCWNVVIHIAQNWKIFARLVRVKLGKKPCKIGERCFRYWVIVMKTRTNKSHGKKFYKASISIFGNTNHSTLTAKNT